MSAPEFSVGEWVERRLDGAVGKVKRTEPYQGDFVYYIDLDPRRPDKDDVWAGTAGAWRTHHRVHAHVTTDSSDCDGTYSGGYMVEATLQERCDEYGDFLFKDRVLASVVSLHGSGTLSVTPDGLEWYEDTDEGHRAANVEWCEDDCGTERSWQRDHRAEAMGY